MPALLLWAIEALVGLVIRYAGPMLFNLLLFFGLSFFTQKYATGPILGFISSTLGGAPAMIVKAFAALSFDKAITIILSAYATAAAGRVILHRRST